MPRCSMQLILAYKDSLDIAICIVTTQEHECIAERVAIPLDTHIPLRLPLVVRCPPNAPTYTLFDMVGRGLVPPPLGDIEHINLVETGNGDCIIGKVT
jgi:hypothetical protein